MLSPEPLGNKLMVDVLVGLQCSYAAACPVTVLAEEPAQERVKCLCPACIPPATQPQLLAGLS